MAHSKTTPGQVAAQIAAGATVLAICYRSLYKTPEPAPTLHPEAAQSSAAPSDTTAALDAETTKTAGKYWAAKQQQGKDTAGKI